MPDIQLPCQIASTTNHASAGGPFLARGNIEQRRRILWFGGHGIDRDRGVLKVLLPLRRMRRASRVIMVCGDAEGQATTLAQIYIYRLPLSRLLPSTTVILIYHK